MRALIYWSFCLTIIVVSKVSVSAQNKGEVTFAHHCFKELEVTVKNYGYLKDLKAYGWGIKIKNNYKSPVSFTYSLMVGDEKPGHGQPTYVLKPGQTWQNDWGRLKLLLKSSSSIEYKVNIWGLCFKGYDCSDENYFDCDGRQIKDKLYGANWREKYGKKTHNNSLSKSASNNSEGLDNVSKDNKSATLNNMKDINIEDFTEKVDINPTFNGGSNGWINYITKNLKAEVPAINGAPPGKYTAIVEFIVSKEGTVSNATCVQDPGYGTCAEAIRVIKQGPNWIPAKLNGRNVATRYRQSVTFLITAE